MGAKKQEEKETKGGILNFLWEVLKMVDAYGYFKIIFSAILMVFISYTTYIALNPSVVFERYRQYEEECHTESFNYRMESIPIVTSIMDNMINETGALRGFIIEMHNGKYNSAGLSFNYGSLTYESDRDGVEPIQEDYSDFTLDRYPILLLVYREGKWHGTIDDLKKLDRRLALRLESNDAHSIYLTMIYGVKNEIGFIGLTFGKDDNETDPECISNILNKYSSKVSPYLDGERIKYSK